MRLSFLGELPLERNIGDYQFHGESYLFDDYCGGQWERRTMGVLGIIDLVTLICDQVVDEIATSIQGSTKKTINRKYKDT
jgi:hypothetical protein